MSRAMLIAVSLLVLATAAAPAAEKLDRGTVALRTAETAVYVGWRLLADDPPDVAFHVYRLAGAGMPERVTTAPVRDCTNFVDENAPKEGNLKYFVRTVPDKDGGPRCPDVAVADGPTGAPYFRIKLQGPYTAHKAAVADLDGDGRMEIIIQQPDFNVDPYQHEGYWKKSEDTYKLEAYTLDGKFLWRHDMGWSIEEGTWYAPYVVYDLDGDGKAEVYCKGGEGDPREPAGHVKTGPEWLL